MLESDWKLDGSSGNKVVWMINQYAITPDLPGGTRHFDFGCELVKRGYEVYIFASDINLGLRKHMKLRPGELWREEEIEGVRFIWVRAALYEKNDWRRAWNMLSFSWNVRRVAKQISSKPDVIIGSSPHPFAALAADNLAKRFGVRFVLELRDLWPQALIDMGGISEPGLISSVLRAIEKQLYRDAHRIVVLARGSSNYLIARGVAPEQIMYIPNGVHLANFALGDVGEADVGQTRWRDDFGFSCFTIVYTGAHGPANSLDTVLGAARILSARNRSIQFVLVGDGPSKANLTRQSQEFGLTNVRFMDPMPKKRIPKLLASADAAVITLAAVDTYSYGISPNKLFDYMAAGKPVICAVPGDMAELVEANEAGISTEPENPEALARAAEKLFGMSNKDRQIMGQSGQSLVAREFSRQVLIDRLIDIL